MLRRPSGVRSEHDGVGLERPEAAEDGFLLLGAVVAIFLVLLVLSLAAPTVARELRRDRELEAIHRGNQYVRAIQLYYAKFKHYPGSMDDLEKANNIRFLRQKYVDPMTGKPDWRLIHVGEQKTTLKGFFGQPLTGVATSGLGSVSGMVSPGIGGGSSSASGSGSSGAGSGSSVGGSSLGGSSLGGSSVGGSSLGAGTGSSASGSTVGGSSGSSGSSSGGVSSQSATSFTGTGAPIVGIGSSATGESMTVLNEQTTYPTWEFIYDPRMEQMKAKVNLLGGGMASTSATTFGSSNGLNSPSSFGTSPGSTSPGSTSPGSASPGSTSPSSPTSSPGTTNPTGP